ncbi:MAG TPA: 50S ribosomal protein L24 [Gemmatimonadaceae bacterium]|nr:50S ribosomal protein L24 [Gemmatimonadaceae bacterium]
MRKLVYRAGERRKNAVRHAVNVERTPLHIRVGDTVRVMRGKDARKEGKVLRIYPKTGRVVVEGANVVKRHRRAQRPDEQSEIIEMPAPIHASNVMLLDPKTGEPVRIRRRTPEAKGTDRAARVDARRTKERISVKSGDVIPVPTSR